MAMVTIHGKDYDENTVMINVHMEGQEAPCYVGYLDRTPAGYCVQTLKMQYPKNTFYLKDSTAGEVARLIAEKAVQQPTRAKK